jgi:two-component system sensor histidine kinase UhpB
VARHAHARTATLALRREGDDVELSIRDDGRGIGAATDGAGLLGMRERALLIGAQLEVSAAAPGTTIRLTISQ